ncbi:hypothetical protein SLS62_008771 [Diatrype stigma]|uniref:Uncharacterized protein n=1 Tax=Diatrype stigma TaxID=117547 RepID=A0AAN9YMX5_9PEZI
MTTTTKTNVELLAVWFHEQYDDEEWDGSGAVECRFLVDSKCIKYVLIEADVYPAGWALTKDINVEFPAFPKGGWNWGVISSREGKPYFSSTKLEALPGISNVWHPVNVDYSELTAVDSLQARQPWTLSEKERLVTHPLFERPVHMKLAQLPRDTGALERETCVYQAIDGKGIGPKFLGNVTEAGRGVIGILTEWDEGAKALELTDRDACLEVLGKLHGCGITYRGLYQLDDNFTRVGSGGADGKKKILMRNFETAEFSTGPSEREQDMQDIERQFLGKADLELLKATCGV